MKKHAVLLALSAICGIGASTAGAGPGASEWIRRPYGIYAYVVVESIVNGVEKPATYASHNFCATVPTTNLDTCFESLYTQLVANPAVSGIAIEVNWSTLNPNAPRAGRHVTALDCSKHRTPGPDASYAWFYVDDAFCAVDAWNSAHRFSPQKSVQLMVTPGFGTPGWALAKLPLSCDGLFQSPPVAPTGPCGQATLLNYEGQLYQPKILQPLPMPWDPTYNRRWKKFLTAVDERYGREPSFASIAVDGPSATTYEMILPINAIAAGSVRADGTAPYPIPSSGLSEIEMWKQIIANQDANGVFKTLYPGDKRAFVDTDEAVIQAWEAAIDTYGSIFSHTTLIANYGGLLPLDDGSTTPATFSPTPMSKLICPTAKPGLACIANAEIFAHFVSSTVGGNNAKATMFSGVQAGLETITWLNELSVKALSNTAAPEGQILGGGQFTVAVTGADFSSGTAVFDKKYPGPLPEGCPWSTTDPSCKPCKDVGLFAKQCLGSCVPTECLAPKLTLTSAQASAPAHKLSTSDLMSPEQGMYYVLRSFFAGTAIAPSYGLTAGSASLNYAQIYYADILYAGSHTGSPVNITVADGTAGATRSLSTTSQQELDTASAQLMTIAQPPPPTPPKPPGPKPVPCPPPGFCQH